MIFPIVGQGTNGSSSSTDEVPKVIGMNYDDAVLNYPNIDFEWRSRTTPTSMKKTSSISRA
ncbi:MAG: hypothetical protein ACLSFT_02725 [Ruminococcus callidus]